MTDTTRPTRAVNQMQQNIDAAQKARNEATKLNNQRLNGKP